MKQTILERIDWGEMALENSMNHPQIQSALKNVGYPISRLQEGKQLLEEVRQHQRMLSQAISELAATKRHIYERLDKVKQIHARHRNLARIAFQDDLTMYTRLRLSKLSSAIQEWLSYAENFYQIIISEGEEIYNFGISRKELNTTQQEIAYLISKKRLFSCKSNTERVNKATDRAISHFDYWLHDFENTTRKALKDQPDLMDEVNRLFLSL